MWGWATCHALGILMYILLVRGGIDGVGVASGKEYYRECWRNAGICGVVGEY